MFALRECSQLKVLKLFAQPVRNFGVVLEKNKNLEELRFDECSSFGVDPKTLTTMLAGSKITKLFAGFQYGCNPAVLIALFTLLPKLRSLHFCINYQLTLNLVTIGKLCPEIVHLGWSDLIGLSHSEFMEIICQYRNLQSINIACARNLTNESYIELATQHGHSLRALCVNGVNVSAVDGLVHLLNSCINLHTLRVDAQQVTSATSYLDEILQRVGEHVQLTTLIILGECSHELLMAISQKQRQLKELCFARFGLKRDEVDVILSNCIHLEKLGLSNCRDYSDVSSVVNISFYHYPEFDVTTLPIV
jgi:hypothetical protein